MPSDSRIRNIERSTRIWAEKRVDQAPKNRAKYAAHLRKKERDRALYGKRELMIKKSSE